MRRNSNKNAQLSCCCVFGMETHDMTDQSTKELKTKTAGQMHILISVASCHKKMVALGEIGSHSLFGPKLVRKNREDPVMAGLQKNLIGDINPPAVCLIGLYQALVGGGGVGGIRTKDDHWAEKFEFVHHVLGCEG